MKGRQSVSGRIPVPKVCATEEELHASQIPEPEVTESATKVTVTVTTPAGKEVTFTGCISDPKDYVEIVKRLNEPGYAALRISSLDAAMTARQIPARQYLPKEE